MIDEAVAAIRKGVIVGVPTDTVYGIGADPLNAEAVQTLYRLKGRPPDKPIGLLVATEEQAREVIIIPEYAQPWIEANWPGPLTLVGRGLIEPADGVADTATGSIGVRVPASRPCLRLIGRSGPLAVTSANRAGASETRDEQEAAAVFANQVAVYVPGFCPGGMASTVVDVTSDRPLLLRPGPIDLGIDRQL
jgi:L-threonylcarbamoyladenylate synthase